MGSLKQRRGAGALLTACLLVACNHLTAQATTRLFGGVGLSIPAGDFSAYANNGWSVTGAVERSFGRHPSALRLDVTYAVNLDSTAIGFHETTKLTSAMVSWVYHFEGSRPHIYALVGMGVLHREFSSDDPDDLPIDNTDFALQLGEGVYVRIKSAKLYLEGRFVSTVGSGAFRYFPVTVGVRF